MKNIKSILAIGCVVALVAMYLVTLIFAITDNSSTMYMFGGCVLCTIFIPLAAYCGLCLHKYAMTRSGRKDFYEKKDSDDGSSSDK